VSASSIHADSVSSKEHPGKAKQRWIAKHTPNCLKRRSARLLHSVERAQRLTGRSAPGSVAIRGARSRGPSTYRSRSAPSFFVSFAYATVTGFNYNVSSIGRSSVPFLTVADHFLWRSSHFGLGRWNRLRARHPRCRRKLLGPHALLTAADRDSSQHGYVLFLTTLFIRDETPR
jgi:hypothetical protein